MLISEVLDEVAQMGEVTCKDIHIPQANESQWKKPAYMTYSNILRQLYKRGLLERENVSDNDRPKYKYTLSDKGRGIIDKFGSYKRYQIVMASSAHLKCAHGEETDLPKKIQKDNE